MTLQQFLQDKRQVTEFRGIEFTSFGDYVIGSEKFTTEDELNPSDFWEYEIDSDCPFNNPEGGTVAIKHETTEQRFLYVFK